MSDILSQTEEFKFKEEKQDKPIETTKEIDFPDRGLGFYELFRFFDITSPIKLVDQETTKKVKTIYEYLKDSKDILSAARELNSKLGNPLELEEKLNKMYAYVYSLKLEEKFKEKKAKQDARVQEIIEGKKAEKKEIEAQKAIREKEERIRKLLTEREKEIAQRKERRLRAIAEEELKEMMEIIKKTKSPPLPSPPKVNF